MKKLKLINLSKKPIIEKAAMVKLRGGGDVCCCGCCGTSGTYDNYNANYVEGYTCTCGDTLIGI